ncbi:hypothetical protein HPB50_003946 [Hyalomma asiaticum]|uniref:Uncharacterized protein n=1 Tax=Hyalomma asiaticum TaxID=266040 RepID=A0ACB7RHG7_HYAAI|nr:hypothetical protein HPB50_003946 [Hyalomma asiaticum]
MAQTSLARQLQKLATPQTSLLKETKTRVSFLFDPREAAALDTDTAYAIGTTGLEELSTLNEAFLRFEENLFSENAKFVERAVKSKEENAILDGQIEEFLLLLSPHFLLRPAHKALEWLVYSALRDPGTLKFVCELLVAMAKVHSENAVALRPAIGLYASTVLGTLEAMKKITDQTVAMILPYILKGLASSAIPDHRAATYLVVAQLARRTVLNREFSRELVIRVAKSLKAVSSSGASVSGGLLCLLVLMTLQDIQELPKAAFQALLSLRKSLVAALEELSTKHSVSAILKPLLAQLTKLVLESPPSENNDANKRAAILKALIQLALSLDKYSKFIVCLFFDAYIELHTSTKAGDGGTASNSLNEEAVLDIMKMLRQRCPDEVDACLERHLCGDNEQARLAAEQLIHTNAFGREHALVEATGSALFLALNSASKHHRVAAVRELVTSLQKKQDVDENFARESLRKRLLDTEPEVVQAVLALGKDLCNFVEQSVVLSTLRRTLFEPVEESTKWFDLRTRALAFVCDDLCTVVDEGQLLATLLPFLMPTEKSEMSLARVAYASRALQQFPMFKTVTTDKRMTAALEAEDLDTITELLLATVAENVGKTEQPLVLVKTLEELCFPSTGYAAAQLRCVCGSLLNALASSTKNTEVFHEVLQFYRQLLAEKAACGDYDFAVAAVRDGRVPSAMVISGLTAVIDGVKPVSALNETPMWVLNQKDEATRATLDILTNIFEMVAENSLVKGSCRLQFRELLRKFFKVHCPSLEHQMHFLSGLWVLHLDSNCSDSQGALATPQKERLQSLALAVSVQLLRDAKGIKWILAEKSLLSLSIILSLLSPTQGIRDLAVSLVEASVACSQKGRTGLHALFELIVGHAADISMGTKKLLKLVASWDSTLKKPNTLLALLNHDQVPVAVQCGILKLVSRVDSKVSKDLVKKFPKENQAALLDTLVDLALDMPPAVEHSAVLRALRKVCSFGSLLVEPLQRTSTSQQSPAKTVREVKKMRSLDLNQSPHVEYLRQCVLTALQAHGLSAPRHELATLVKCLRHSQSAQAQQLSLGLLNLAAQKYPEEVLHNVTSVFTFMGANLLRLDDNYSFQTVMQTVETVVPALLQACAGESKSAEASESAVASVTRVFVGAFLDIPEHRRLPLFTKLVTTLGASDHLWVLAAQMAEHHTTKMAGRHGHG